MIQNPLLTKGGKQVATFINEPNLYRLIFRSDKAQAKAFQDWEFNDVLPALRNQGYYGIEPTKPQSPNYEAFSHTGLTVGQIKRFNSYLGYKPRLNNNEIGRLMAISERSVRRYKALLGLNKNSQLKLF